MLRHKMVLNCSQQSATEFENQNRNPQQQLPEVFYKKAVLKISQFLQQSTCVGNKVATLQACSFIKKRLQHRFFPVNIAKLLRTPIILKNNCEPLLLNPIKWKLVTQLCNVRFLFWWRFCLRGRCKQKNY